MERSKEPLFMRLPLTQAGAALVLSLVKRWLKTSKPSPKIFPPLRTDGSDCDIG